MSNTDVQSPSATTPAAPEPRARSGGDQLARLGLLLLRGRTLVVLILLIILFGSISQDYLTSGNLIVMTKHVAINAILAIGVTFVILTGGIDLSVGAIAGLSSMIVGGLLFSGLAMPGGGVLYPSVLAVILLGILVRCFVGWVNGTLITKFRAGHPASV
jgi:erythritol transport system permease protein